MERKKKGKIRKRLRALLFLLILVLLLLLLDGRFGLGDGLKLTSSPQDASERNVPSQTDTTITIEVIEQSILLENEAVTLDELSDFLAGHDKEAIFILVDQRANNALFNEVENLLISYDILYAIED